MSSAFDEGWGVVKMVGTDDWPLGPGQEPNAFNEEQLIRYILSHVMDLHQSEDPSELEHLMWLGQELSRAQQPGVQEPHDDWDSELADDDPMQESARDYMMGDRYNPPQMMPRGGDMAQIMQFLQGDPDVYQDTGYDGSMAGHYGGMSMKRPDMEGAYDPHHENDQEPFGAEQLGDYEIDEGNIRGELSQIKLMQVLRDLMGGGSI